MGEPTKFNHDRWGVIMGIRSGVVGTEYTSFSDALKKSLPYKTNKKTKYYQWFETSKAIIKDRTTLHLILTFIHIINLTDDDWKNWTRWFIEEKWKSVNLKIDIRLKRINKLKKLC